MKINKLKKQGLILCDSDVVVIESTLDVPTLYVGAFKDIPDELLERKIDFMAPNRFDPVPSIRIFVLAEG